MEFAKFTLLSKTIWGILISCAPMFFKSIGLTFTEDDSALFNQAYDNFMQLAGTGFAIFGRVVAKGPLTLQIKSFTNTLPVLLVGIGLVAMCSIQDAHAQNFPVKRIDPANPDVVLSWVIPTTREDGSALAVTEIAGYEIYYDCGIGGPVDPTKQGTVVIPDPTLTSYKQSWSVFGECAFAIATVDKNGLFSANSDAVTLVIDGPASPPSPPTLLQIILAWLVETFGWLFA